MSVLDPEPKTRVRCPTCGNDLLVSIARIDAEGLPWCTHDHGSITYGGTPYPTWTRMVKVGAAEAAAADARAALDAKPQIEVRVVFADGSQESRVWTWGEVRSGTIPDPAIKEWMVEPRRTWAHSQDPIIFSTLVAEGREQEAREWLTSL